MVRNFVKAFNNVHNAICDGYNYIVGWLKKVPNKKFDVYCPHSGVREIYLDGENKLWVLFKNGSRLMLGVHQDCAIIYEILNFLSDCEKIFA